MTVKPIHLPDPPPRAEDLPFDDGEPLESARHRDQMNLLIDSLQDAWHHRDDFFVGGNMFLYYSELQARTSDFRGPDVFVVLDTPRRERLSWVVWQEDGRTPDLIIELVSASTERVDRVEKMRVYANIRVPEYVIFDPFSARLDAFHLDASGTYVPVAPDSHGRVASARLGLSLGTRRSTFHDIDADWLRWFDGDGQLLQHGAERAAQEAQRAAQEAQRAEQQAQRAEQEAQRAEQEAQRADEEAQRADDETRRADDETRRADDETRRADELAAIIARYEARFGRLPEAGE